MKLFKFSVALIVTLALIYTLDHRWVIEDQPIPPLGKFLDPFQGFWKNAKQEALPYKQTIDLPQLKEEVYVAYDSSHIPHIFAQNNHDLFMAQGYIIAQHRLWQMDFQMYASSGRISELIGKNGIRFDQLQRRKGMVYGAKKSLGKMKESEELYSYIEAYTAGVNAYISELKYKDLPLEYKLLNYEPEPWTPLKSSLLLQYMIDNLSGWDQDLENTNAYNLFGPKIFDTLYPNYTNAPNPVAPTPDSLWNFDATVTPRPDSILFNKNFTTTVHKMPDPDNGSNNWAVAGWKTKSGAPILSSDMHLGLNLPSLWFMIELNSPDISSMGFCLAGNIGIVAGFNQNNAWSFTDVSRDERDWYNIRFVNSSNREQYYFEGSKLRAETVIEEIKVRNDKTVYDTVIYTHHGPIVYDRNFLSGGGEENLALKWIGHYPSEVQLALFELNRSKGYNDYLQALEYWDAPAQHVAFAGTDGDIAIRVQGLWPNKYKSQGRFVMDGTKKEMEWPPFIPTKNYAFQHNPGRGFVSSANQHSTDQKYPYWQGWANPDHYRGRRINNVLESYDPASITPQDMMKLQNDSYGILPSEVLPFMLDSLTYTDTSDSLLQALKQWDYNFTTEKTAPMIFTEWWREYKKLLWDEMSNDSLALNYPTDFQTVQLMKSDSIPRGFYDILSTGKTEGLKDLLSQSYDSALNNLAQWNENSDRPFNWGNYKGTSIIHLARLPALSRMNIHVDGEDDVVNSTKRNHGPSQRLVVEMTSPPKAWAIIPGGQSGNPGNPAYDNMIDDWRDGRYLQLDFMRSQPGSPYFFQKLKPTAEEK